MANEGFSQLWGTKFSSRFCVFVCSGREIGISFPWFSAFKRTDSFSSQVVRQTEVPLWHFLQFTPVPNLGKFLWVGREGLPSSWGEKGCDQAGEKRVEIEWGEKGCNRVGRKRLQSSGEKRVALKNGENTLLREGRKAFDRVWRKEFSIAPPAQSFLDCIDECAHPWRIQRRPPGRPFPVVGLSTVAFTLERKSYRPFDREFFLFLPHILQDKAAISAPTIWEENDGEREFFFLTRWKLFSPPIFREAKGGNKVCPPPLLFVSAHSQDLRFKWRKISSSENVYQFSCLRASKI